MRRIRKYRGLTLIETLIVGGLFASVSLIMTLWLNGVSDLWWTSSTQAQARTHIQQSMSRMLKELRGTTRSVATGGTPLLIPSSPNNTQVTFYLPKDLDGNGTILNAQGGIEWDNASAAKAVQYTYDAAARQVKRIQGGQQQVLTNGVTDVRFEDRTIDATLASDEVRIRMSVQFTTPRGRFLQASANQVVKLRN